MVATEFILEVRYMLRSLGLALDGPALMLLDIISIALAFFAMSHDPIKFDH
jgi:hypothetical protein